MSCLNLDIRGIFPGSQISLCDAFLRYSSHKSHNTLEEYPTMHHFVTEMCTYVHISVTEWYIVEYSSNALCRVPSRGGFGGFNPHQNHLDPHFIWPWVQWTLCIDLIQAGSNFSYGILKSLVCWWPHSSFVLYNVIRKYNICSRIKCQHVTCAQYDPASTPERVNLLLQMKTK